MQFRQYLPSVVVALCVADHVAGQTGRNPRRVPNGVAQASRGVDTALSDVRLSGSGFATSEAPREAAVQGERNDEDDQRSSSESLPNASINEKHTASPVVHLVSRQEEAESIPTPDPNALPIEPKITPAMGIAGAVMLASGVALCLVGIKKPWLHISLSTAYLASLAVTVLIVYVMNPDHSDAIQGAYVVAAIVTGLIFGAVSLVFQEVTEGLGCMLGSFCFAMWILVLAPGGIIHSTAGRGILIGVITVAGFGLSFTHHTRMYALLCCTSFAGATITILGVDCFSRAGLKEFWLYLWNLNDKQFPLETNTYPITRGIRVEIACVIVVFLLGLVSQFKLWKVIKARRDKNEEDRRRAEDERLEAEAAVGRDIEAKHQKERAEWEAVYGEKRASRVHTDSGVGSSVETFGKDQISVKEREVDPIELSDIAEVQSGRNSNGENNLVPEGERKSGELAEGTVDDGERSGRKSHESMQRSDTGTEKHEEKHAEINELDAGYAPGAPEVVPLPFRVPTGEQEKEPELDQGSQASKRVAETAPFESVGMPLQKLSLMQLNQQYASESFERRDDQASSVAATADDIAVMGDVTPGRMSVRHSLVMQDPEDSNRLALPQVDSDRSRRTSVVSEREMEVALDEDDEEALPRDPVTNDPVTIDESGAPVPAGLTKKASTAAKSNRRLSDATKVSKQGSSSEGHPGSVSEGLVEQLPPKLSKIALTYRTNEWAKHIADADQPENPEELERPSSPGVQVDTNFPKEVPRAVDVEALQQTAAPVEQAAPTHSTSKASRKSHRKSRHSEPVINLNRSSSTQSITPVYAFNRSSSQMSLNRNDSTSSSPARPKLGSMRQSSMPLTNQPLVESPVEDAAETFQPHDFAPTSDIYPNPLASTSAGNLLDERNQMLQRRPTTTSFNGFRSTPTLGMMSGAIPEDQVHRSEEATPGISSPTQSSPTLPANFTPEDENMTLSQRRSLMQLNQTQTATPTHKPRASIYSTMAYDSHQPARQSSTNSVQQSQRLNQWRQTLQADVQAKQPPRAVESNARQNMLDERRQSEMRHARKKEQLERRQSTIDEAMRRGQLDGVHRDAMRKMQAKANKDGA